MGDERDQRAQLQKIRDEVPAERLHLVIQEGRLFEQRNPEVRPLLDEGRYLVVDLEPAEARRRSGPGSYSIEPLGDVEVLVEPLSVLQAAPPVPRITSLVDQLSQTRYESDLRALSGFFTRLSTTQQFLDAATWARGQFPGAYTLSEETFSVPGGSSKNIVADKEGSKTGARQLVIVVAHLDTLNTDGPGEPAPGADDNASGSAGVLEMARVFAGHTAEHDLRFLLTGGEEQGLHGSRHHVKNLSKKDRKRISAVINMDMIGYRFPPAPPTVLLEGEPISESLVEGLKETAATYTTLELKTASVACCSDHVPFLDAKIPAVMTISFAPNGKVHSADDTIDHLDLAFALQVLRMNTAFVAEVLG